MEGTCGRGKPRKAEVVNTDVKEAECSKEDAEGRQQMARRYVRKRV